MLTCWWISGYTYIIGFRYSHINDTPTPILYGVVLLNAYKLSNNNKIGYTKKNWYSLYASCRELRRISSLRRYILK